MSHGPSTRAAALPFVVRREHDDISRGVITTTRDEIDGLLRLDGDRVVVQWRATRETTRVGREFHTSRALAPVREVAVPLDAVAGARVQRQWRRWALREVLVLTAADLRAFEALAGERRDDVAPEPGLAIEHPAELTVELRRRDRAAAREFVVELELALAERALRAAERGGGAALPAGDPARLTAPPAAPRPTA